MSGGRQTQTGAFRGQNAADDADIRAILLRKIETGNLNPPAQAGRVRIIARRDLDRRFGIPNEADKINVENYFRRYGLTPREVAQNIDKHRNLQRASRDLPIARYNPREPKLDEINDRTVDNFCCYLLVHLIDLVQKCGTEDTIKAALDEYCDEADPFELFNYKIPTPRRSGDAYRLAVHGWVLKEVLIRRNFLLYPAYRSLMHYDP
ncbi:MAG: hypothetical protein Q9214_003933 [Letrouitia sp. 1 TL-2023]